MVMDEFGEGQVVQQSLLETNTDWHMEKALQHFKRAHLDRFKLLRVVVVDKDLQEIRVLQSHFPEARILICLFHVIKYIKTVSRKPEYGKISADDHAAIDHLIHNMIYAATPTEYDENCASLQQLCLRLDFLPFFAYMEKNWHSCQEMWVMHRRAKLPHFKNHTSNRLENFFGKFKDGVGGSTSMAKCVDTIIATARRRENEYVYRKLRVGRYINMNYDEEMTQVLRFTTHFVAEQIQPEYAAAMPKSDDYMYAVDKDKEVVVVQGHQ